MSDLQETLGAVIRHIRRAHQLSRQELARRAAVSAVYLGEVERGEKYPSARVLEQLAAALDVAIPDLLVDVAQHLRGERTPVLLAPIGFTRQPEGRKAREPVMQWSGSAFGVGPLTATRPPLVVLGHDDREPSPMIFPLRLAR